MKRIVCELCEGTEFVKENGMFVCQGCGTKYTAEEARSLMQEVENNSPAVTGTPAVAAPMDNSNQVQIDNMLVLATTAYEAHNFTEAENYCNRVIELDAMCYKAWNLKGKAVGWQSTIDNLRIEEASHSFCKAIDFAPEAEKEDLKGQAVETLKQLGIALISLRKKSFSDNPNTTELNGFTSDKVTVLDALLVLLSHGNAVGIPEGFLDEVAKLMNDAGAAAMIRVRTTWETVEHPSKEEFMTYLDWNSNICEVFRQAISTGNDDEGKIAQYKNLINALKEPIGKYSQKSEWNSSFARYDWVKDYTLTAASENSRLKEISLCESKLTELEEKVAEDKKKIIELFWMAHADKKEAFEEEKKQLSEKLAALDADIAESDSTINGVRTEEKAPTSSEAEIENLRDQIRDLMKRKDELGMFSGKEKKRITEEIATFNERIDSLRGKIDEEKRARAQDILKRLVPVQEEKAALISERVKVTERISEIENILSTGPEDLI